MGLDDVRVRIAPSPTGYFHVGTARTAIYNWLFAKKHGGKFLLRIEDTDLDRSRQEYVDIILDGLRWMGLSWDEEIVYQSERMETYSPHAERLLTEGKAYRCFCSPEELTAEREYAQKNKLPYKYSRKCRSLSPDEIEKNLSDGRKFTVRLKLPVEGTASFEDAIAGKLNCSYDELDDLIILKSNGRPIYNFVVVVDDHDMRISHVIRGNDHITNTYYQVELYKALEWDIPEFAHVPLILRPDRSKVSKRKGDKGVTDYKDEGYLPQALVNYSALVGWSPKDDREKMTIDEMIEAFSLEGVNPNNAVFDIEKLKWMNGEYLREIDSNKIVDLVVPLFIEAGLTTKYWVETNWHWTVRVVDALKERCRLLSEYAEKGSYFFTSNFEYDPKGVRKQFKADGVASILTDIKERFEQVDVWMKEGLEETLRILAEDKDLKAGKLIHPVRLAVSGMTGGPGLFDILELLGQKEVQARIERAIKYIERGEFPEQEGT
ncbi:MAG: glutamate--tRNA ligase [candidate division Zixibacteria bacterium]|nr:glutamate--tRNA ligase [candidate division Zixibacteria bacterium]MBU1470536.1 glutamate--tRNA ligase [candidate division Zixibacteria bacterium]MBU2625518.1 glutamate--tRNA ligase [candidate division Zixibacteria bacterium]